LEIRSQMKDYPTNLNTDDNWDFETGDLSFWSAEGDAFSNQPVRGDRVSTSRVRPVTLGGDYWDVPLSTPLWGFADLHCHPMAHIAFGGHLFWGKPTDPVKKLQRCDGKGHGGRLFSGYVLHEIEAKDDPRYRSNRHSSGHWPTWTSRTHQEMHIDWIHRAYEGGLRLMCACAVNNQLLEHLIRSSPFTSVKPRDDYSAVLEQVEAIKKLADQQADWMAIAYSSAQARQIIRQGKLALVLAAEVDQLGGWKREQDCTDTQVALLVQMLYGQGLRMITPIHLADNAFGGAAIYSDLFNSLNYYLNGEYFSVEDGYDSGVQFRLQERPERKVVGTRLPRIVKEEMPIIEYLRIPPEHGHANKRGLTERGNFFIRMMMSKGMLIDIDHMSHRSVEDALDMAEQYDYPLVASHCTFRELACSGATEAMKTRQQVERIARLGGVIGPMPTQGEVRALNEVLPISCQVPNDYPGSSKSWAQAYLYAVYLMRGRGVALGTDFNGLVIKPRPRFQDPSSVEPLDFASLGQQASQRNSVRYAHYARSAQTRLRPATRSVDPESFHRPHTPLTASNDGVYDINLMGLAHYGMIPDFLQDGRNIGLSEQDLVPLFRSANDYIEMWERCERRS
jgi:microsomal dipeptidase-like Zn-dependent dipeptidase